MKIKTAIATPAGIPVISTPQELANFARVTETAGDWHEPQLEARVYGTSFDNAMQAGHWYGQSSDGQPRAELYVVFYEEGDHDDGSGSAVLGRPLAVVNLATLCSWAADAVR